MMHAKHVGQVAAHRAPPASPGVVDAPMTEALVAVKLSAD